MLASIGLADRNGDGVLEDARNRPARFTLLTQKGRPALERGSAVIRDELKKIGVVVDVVALDGGALIQRIGSRHAKYDAIYFNAAIPTDTDPAINPDFWFSFGSAHLWNMAQKTPATDWERRIDELMARQIASPDEAERKRLFDEVQKVFAEHVPVVYFVAPRVYVAVSSRASEPHAIAQLLWAADAAVAGRHERVGAETSSLLGGPDTVGRDPLTRYIARRLAFAVFLVFAVSSASLVLARLAPGDYVTESLGIEAHRETVEQARARYGLDKSIGAQYRDWLVARRAPRLRPLAALRPAGPRSHSRARGQHRDPRAHRARSSPRSSACRSASSRAAAAAA